MLAFTGTRRESRPKVAPGGSHGEAWGARLGRPRLRSAVVTDLRTQRHRAPRRSWGRWSVAVVVAVSLLPGCKRGSKGQKPSADVQALLAQLGKEQRMASVGRVRARCEGALAERCACTQTAVREALDDTLAVLARDLLTH